MNEPLPEETKSDMTYEELQELLVEGVKRGMWVAVKEADGGVRFFHPLHASPEQIKHALTPEQLEAHFILENNPDAN